MRRIPTRRALVIALIGGLLITAGATAQAGWLFVLSAAVFGLVGGSLLMNHRLTAVEVARRHPRRARAGDDVRAGISLRNKSRRSVPLFVVEDHYPAFEPVSVACASIPGGTAAEVELVRTAVRRGVFNEGEVQISSAAPFGLTRSRRDVQVASDLTVVPRWVELQTFPVQDPAPSPAEMTQPRARSGTGHEYLGIREYRPGDPVRSVHWRSSARASKLIVREYEQEVATPVGVVVCGPDHGTPPSSSFEAVVSAAASIALYAHAKSHPVFAVAYGKDRIDHIDEPGRHDLLDWLATVRPVDRSAEPLVSALRSRMGARGTCVLCGTSAGTSGSSLRRAADGARREGLHVVEVVADASSWDPSVAPLDGSSQDRGVRVLSADRDLAECLAG